MNIIEMFQTHVLKPFNSNFNFLENMENLSCVPKKSFFKGYGPKTLIKYSSDA